MENHTDAVTIITTKIPNFRHNEIINWLRKNIPRVKSVSSFSIDGETGKQHWLSLTRKGVRTLPQIFITQGEETIHIGELEDLIAWHTEAIKKSKEVELL